MGNAKVLYKKKIRFVFDVEVSVEDYPQSILDGLVTPDEHVSWAKENPKEYREWIEFQKRILHAAVNNPDVVWQLAFGDATNELANYCDQYRSYDEETSLEKLILPVIDNLSAQDKEKVNELINNEVLPDNTEPAFFDSFKAYVTNSDFKILE